MSDWVEKRLGDLAEIRISNVDKKSVAGERPVRLCNYMDVYANDYLDDSITYMEATATERERQTFSLSAGDVLITKDSETPDDIGIPAIIDETSGDLVCGYHLALLRPDRRLIEPQFLAKQLATNAVQSFYSRRAAGSTRYALSTATIANTPILVPPLDKQRKIGRVLRLLDVQIEATEALIAKQEQVRQGLMQDLFTRGIDANGELRPTREEAPHLYCQTKLGWLPIEWEVSPLSCLVNSARAGCSVNSLSRPAYSDEFGILKTSCVQGGLFYPNENKAVEYIEHHRLIESVAANSIIVSRMNTPELVGESGFSEFELESRFLPDRLWQLQLIDPTYAFWASRLIQSFSIKERIKRLATGTSGTMKNIEKARFMALLLPISQPRERVLATGVIRSIDAHIDATSGHLEKLRHEKFGLMQDLLTGRVSVASLLGNAVA